MKNDYFSTMGAQNKSIQTNLNYSAKPSIFQKAQMLRKNMTEAEKHLWERLKDNQFNGYKFRRQHPIDIFVVDFYCHKAKLIVEIDGENHNRFDVKEYDNGLTAELNNHGLKVLRFSNEQVLNDIENVIDKISIFLD